MGEILEIVDFQRRFDLHLFTSVFRVNNREKPVFLFSSGKRGVTMLKVVKLFNLPICRRFHPYISTPKVKYVEDAGVTEKSMLALKDLSSSFISETRLNHMRYF